MEKNHFSFKIIEETNFSSEQLHALCFKIYWSYYIIPNPDKHLHDWKIIEEKQKYWFMKSQENKLSPFLLFLILLEASLLRHRSFCSLHNSDTDSVFSSSRLLFWEEGSSLAVWLLHPVMQRNTHSTDASAFCIFIAITCFLSTVHSIKNRDFSRSLDWLFSIYR